MAIVRTTWGAVLAVLLGALMLGAPVQAQDGPAWIQLEALPDKVIAAQRALAYSADIEGVSGFSLGPN